VTVVCPSGDATDQGPSAAVPTAAAWDKIEIVDAMIMLNLLIEATPEINAKVPRRIRPYDPQKHLPLAL